MMLWGKVEMLDLLDGKPVEAMEDETQLGPMFFGQGSS
jgi:hypothetical protein